MKKIYALMICLLMIPLVSAEISETVVTQDKIDYQLDFNCDGVTCDVNLNLSLGDLEITHSYSNKTNVSLVKERTFNVTNTSKIGIANIGEDVNIYFKEKIGNETCVAAYDSLEKKFIIANDTVKSCQANVSSQKVSDQKVQVARNNQERAEGIALACEASLNETFYYWNTTYYDLNKCRERTGGFAILAGLFGMVFGMLIMLRKKRTNVIPAQEKDIPEVDHESIDEAIKRHGGRV